MKPVFVGIGLSLVALAGALSGIGHYDGVLGTTNPDALFAPDAPQEATIRVLVKQDAEHAGQRFQGFQSQLRMPPAMQTMMAQGSYVVVEVRPGLEAFMRVLDTAPSVGTVLVATGTIHTFWPIMDTGAKDIRTAPVVFIEPSEYHSPILFKP